MEPKRSSRPGAGRDAAVLPFNPEWLLNSPVHPVSLAGLTRQCGDWVKGRRRGYICAANVHVIVEAVFNAALRHALLGASAVTPDGMPLVWFLRARGHRGQGRAYGPDLMLSVLRMAEARGFRVFLYGSDGETLGILRRKVMGRFPRLRLAGSFSPPFRKAIGGAELRAHARLINSRRPDIVFVGLGAPKQEIWMDRARPHLKAPLLFGVGAAFDFISGRKPQAPKWMMRAGLEWLFRLLSEPARLWKRYLVYNCIFLALLFLQSCGIGRWRRGGSAQPARRGG
jgi:N-acetylglucosaminyldiphosphoundecaprenol N-acetyl-beta-D-mannosaminyltransferase